jgi:hypothetical protein
MAWLMHLNAILNLKRPMADEAIEMCAIEVVNEFYMLKMSDLSFLNVFIQVSMESFTKVYLSQKL